MSLLLEEKLRRQRENRLETYRPYIKQLEFHKAGKDWNERLMQAGNQLGKTLSGGFECAMHLTGLYPSWWEGLRFDKATRAWAGSDTGESTRDGVQRILLGEEENGWGTGTIPKHCIKKIVRSNRVPGGVAFILVQHISGGISRLQFKSYDQGRTKWQVVTLDFVWFDEEPPLEIYTEGLTRTNNGQRGQCAWMTATPLMGMTSTISRFVSEEPGVRGVHTNVTRMGIADVDHYTEAEKTSIIASYLPHEREARANGTPILGSGLVFTKARSEVEIEDFEIPAHWAEIGAVDFGGDHPAAGVKLVHDRDQDIVYLVRVWRARNVKLSEHASAVRSMLSPDTPVAWPHDGNQRDRKSMETFAQELRNEGLNMLPDHAHVILIVNGKETRNVSLEGNVTQMAVRIDKGKFRVFKSCVEFFDEYGMYHRKDGVIQPVRDDIISAARYGLMMIRFAMVPQGNKWSGKNINARIDDSWVT